MGVTYLVLVGSLVVAGAHAASTKPEPQTSTPWSELARQRKQPYTRIFPAPRPNSSTRTFVVPVPQDSTPKPTMEPRVACGMVVVPVGPEADPKMVRRPTAEPQPDFKIRKIAPPICNE
jgi:hypothetical protein